MSKKRSDLSQFQQAINAAKTYKCLTKGCTNKEEVNKKCSKCQCEFKFLCFCEKGNKKQETKKEQYMCLNTFLTHLKMCDKASIKTNPQETVFQSSNFETDSQNSHSNTYTFDLLEDKQPKFNSHTLFPIGNFYSDTQMLNKNSYSETDSQNSDSNINIFDLLEDKKQKFISQTPSGNSFRNFHLETQIINKKTKREESDVSPTIQFEDFIIHIISQSNENITYSKKDDELFFKTKEKNIIYSFSFQKDINLIQIKNTSPKNTSYFGLLLISGQKFTKYSPLDSYIWMCLGHPSMVFRFSQENEYQYLFVHYQKKLFKYMEFDEKKEIMIGRQHEGKNLFYQCTIDGKTPVSREHLKIEHKLKNLIDFLDGGTKNGTLFDFTDVLLTFDIEYTLFFKETKNSLQEGDYIKFKLEKRNNRFTEKETDIDIIEDISPSLESIKKNWDNFKL